jgi:predicted acetyltransferase
MKLHKPNRPELNKVIACWEKVISEATRDMSFQKQNLERMKNEPDKYLRGLDGEIDGETLKLDDGTVVPRLPSIMRYMWDEDNSVGAISFRWQPGSPDLPSHVLGHIGYETFPWAQRKGFATQALAQMLEIVKSRKDINIKFVDLVTDPDNSNSQKVIANNGGVFIEQFNKPNQADPTCGAVVNRYRITL